MELTIDTHYNLHRGQNQSHGFQTPVFWSQLMTSTTIVILKFRDPNYDGTILITIPPPNHAQEIKYCEDLSHKCCCEFLCDESIFFVSPDENLPEDADPIFNTYTDAEFVQAVSCNDVNKLINIIQQLKMPMLSTSNLVNINVYTLVFEYIMQLLNSKMLASAIKKKVGHNAQEYYDKMAQEYSWIKNKDLYTSKKVSYLNKRLCISLNEIIATTQHAVSSLTQMFCDYETSAESKIQ